VKYGEDTTEILREVKIAYYKISSKEGEEYRNKAVAQ